MRQIKVKLFAIAAAVLVAFPAFSGIVVDARFLDHGDQLPTMQVFVENDDSSDMVYGWTLGLQIVPDGGTGILEFNTATLPSTDYLFEGRSEKLEKPDSPGTIWSPIYDADTGGGIAVPTSANLIDISFVSTNADGKFKVMAFGDEFNGSNLTIGASGFPTIPYCNLPFGSSIELGTIDVTAIPETSAFVLLAVIGLLSWGLRVATSRRRGSGR